jgi:preprotein translocase subunit SecB
MTDAAIPGAPAGGQAAGAQAPAFAITAQYVKDLSFENPRAPHVFLNQKEQPQVQVQVNVQVNPLAQDIYEVALTMEAKAIQANETSFLVDVTYAGVFALTGVAQEHRQPLLLIEGPRLLFPFARQIVAEATREGGFPPLLIQPIDFVELYRRNAANQGAAPPAETAPKS